MKLRTLHIGVFETHNFEDLSNFGKLQRNAISFLAKPLHVETCFLLGDPTRRTFGIVPTNANFREMW